MVTKIHFRLMTVLLFFMFSFSAPVFSQFGLTKSDIAGKLGWNYQSGKTTEEKVDYIYYEFETKNASGEKYTYVEAFYFNDKGYCYQKKLMEPIEEINAWVKYFNKEYVSLGNMRWKDYNSGVVYRIEKDNQIVIVISFWEGN